MLITLNDSVDYLFEKALLPHFVQYHSGSIDQVMIQNWSQRNENVKRQQNSEMINIPGSKIFINSQQAEVDTVMDLSFVRQNESFDFLLNLNNQIISIDQGEIAVPIYYRQRRNLVPGDNVVIKNEQFEMNFIIKEFVRDAQMNPSVISSKRFVVNNTDFEKMKNQIGKTEYLISFQLNDPARISEFTNQYSQSGLPQKGPAVDYKIFKLFNSLTDGLIAAVVILISLLLNIIALLCLRFIILLTIEEDYKEIGVMKGIGIAASDIRKIYLSKYIFIALTGTIGGFLIYLPARKLFLKNIILFTGEAPKSILQLILPLLTALTIAAVVIVFSIIILRRFNKISPVEAIRLGINAKSYFNKNSFSLSKNNFLNANVFLGLRDVLMRFKLFIILFVVFILTTFIIIVPLNFLNTIKSSEFVRYMGIAESDIIMDLRYTEGIQDRFEQIKTYLANDPDVLEQGAFVTSRYRIINQEGLVENIYIQTGDFSKFNVDYLAGQSPAQANEIALSYLSSSELNKNIGDKVQIIIEEERREMIVTGIYQDITNGGRSAKANLPADYQNASWYNIYINLNSDIAEKINEYEALFDNTKIIDQEGYLAQTLGDTIEQLNILTIAAIIIAGVVIFLITSLFLKTLIARDKAQIAIMKSIGTSIEAIKIQYITKALFVLIFAIFIGTITANILGEQLLTIILSFLGASRIEIIINPIRSYLLSPLIMILIVVSTTLLSINSIKKISLADIKVE
ncbi:FtsX-like permease family protein [Halanaerobium saccharolyticum]|nr:FtsX-like permease family protein [Halanaerobium saccharolyticum]